MHCPVCPETNLVMSARPEVEIDHYPKYRGAWLDRGEPGKIIERSAPDQPQRQQAARYQQPPQQQHAHSVDTYHE